MIWCIIIIKTINFSDSQTQNNKTHTHTQAERVGVLKKIKTTGRVWFCEVMIECWIDSDMVLENFYMIPEQIFKLLGNKPEPNDGRISNTFPNQLYSPNQNWFNKTASKYMIVETGNNRTNKSSEGRSWHNYCLTFTCPKNIFEVVASNDENNADWFGNTNPSPTNICKQHMRHRNKQSNT